MTNFHITHRNKVVHWEEIPFAFEHAMAGYILENPQILRLNDSSLGVVNIKGAEVSMGTSGRADITVAYGDSSSITAKAIIELKNVVADKNALDQLKRYLTYAQIHKLDYSIGVLVAPDFNFDVVKAIVNSKNKNVYGIKITRYESDDEFIVMADVIYPKAKEKDYTRYSLCNLQKNTFENLSKARLVWYIVESYIHSKQNILYDDLRQIFKDELHTGSINRTIHLIENENAVPDNLRGRYSKQPIVLDDGTGVLVSNQWGIDNIDRMINKAKELGMEIKYQNKQ